jgi:methionyl-tRNA formyltransferase
MNIIFFGTPQFVVPVLDALKNNFSVTAVVTTPDQKSGRKQLLSPPPVKVSTQKYNLTVIQPKNNASLTSSIINLTSDLFVVAAYGKLIPNDILAIPKHGVINIHPSLLPTYRGPSPVQQAILNGDRETGISFMKLDAQMDHGPLLSQYPYPIQPTDTFETLVTDMFAKSAELLPGVIEDYIANKTKLQPQDDNRATYSKILTKEDGYIDLDNPPSVKKLDGMIRAYYPWPTVWTKTRIKNQEVRIKFLPNKKLQVEGKNIMSIKDFLNGYPEMKEIIIKLYQ